MQRLRLVKLTGSILVAGGFLILSGWLAKYPLWGNFLPGGVAMVFNTALCLLLAGIALLLPATKLTLRAGLGYCIALIAALVLAENIFAINLGVDLPALHLWYPDNNPHPGRMSPNTALALLAGGLALVLRSLQRGENFFGRTLAAVTLTLGVTGLAAHTVVLELAYSWYGIPRMAFSTGIGVTLFGLGLLLEHPYAADPTQRSQLVAIHRIYAFLGMAITILGIVALVSYGSINALIERGRLVEHSNRVRAEFEALSAAYDRMYLSWRDFMILGNAASLAQFRANVDDLPSQLALVSRLTIDNPLQQPRLAAMKKLLDEDIATLERGLRLKRKAPGGLPAGFAPLLMDVNIRRMHFDRLAAAFREEEDSLLAQRQEESQRGANSIVTVIIVGNALGFAILLYGFLALKRLNDARNSLENSLQSNNRFLDSVVENIPNMVFVKDAADLKFVRFNKAGERLLGYSRDDLLGKNDYDFFPKAEADHFTAKDRAVLAQSGLLDIPEETIHTAHQGPRILHTMKIPILDDEGRPQYLLGISEDITERKQAEQKIVELNASLQQRAVQLEASNKELESFSYSVSHDLRAPLRAVDGYALMLEEDYADRFDEEGARCLGKVREHSKRMGILIDELLNFSRLGRQALNKSPLDMHQLAQDVVKEALAEYAGTTPAIKLGLLPPASGDRVLIRQVWVNLILNAIKYSSKAASPVIEISGEQTDGEVVYAVRDNGAGFDMAYYDKLFGVFQRLHHADEFAGTGVGLAIVQRAVTRHGGRVWAEGKIGAGASFYFSLPVGESNE